MKFLRHLLVVAGAWGVLGAFPAPAQTFGNQDRSLAERLAARQDPGVLNRESYGLQEITVVLSAEHSFLFAGFYAAIVQGYYAAEGLTVRLLTPAEAGEALDAVLTRRADFGLTGPELFAARSRGLPVILLAVFLQNSPSSIFLNPQEDLRYPSDLIGQRLMADRMDMAGEVLALLQQEGLDPGGVEIVPMSETPLDDLLAGRVQGILAYDTLWRREANRRGFELRTLRPPYYGVNFPAEFLFTTEEVRKSRPKEVDGFLTATLQGWAYALEHQEEIIRRILRLPGVVERGLTREDLQAEASAIEGFMAPDLIQIGQVNPRRLERMITVWQELGLLPGTNSWQGLLHHTAPATNYRAWLVASLWAAGGLGAIILAIFLGNRHLARTVEKQTAELRQALQQAQSAARAKELFLAQIGEELRPPLNGIIGLTHLLQEQNFSAEHRVYVELMQSSSEHLLDLMENLLDYARLELGRLAVHPAPFPLARTLQEMALTWAKKARAQGLEFSWQFAPDLPEWVETDGYRLRQILFQLLDNALKYTPAGLVVFNVSRAAQATDGWVFSVRDTGIGLTERMQARLFEKFSQADSSLTRQHGGTGLGLALAQRLCELLGGRIQVESTPGRGSEFFFMLSLSAISQPTAATFEVLPSPSILSIPR